MQRLGLTQHKLVRHRLSVKDHLEERMKEVVTKVKTPLENINRRSVLGVLGVGMTGVFVACNDDVSPLKLSLKSDAVGEITAAGSVMLTATVGAGLADTIEFYESSLAGDLLLDSITAKPLVAASKNITYTAADNGTHAYYGKITSVTGKDAPSNPVVIKVNIPVTQPPVLPTVTLSSSSASVTTAGTITLTADVTGSTVTQIEFFEGTTSLGIVATAPYTKTITFTATSPAQSHNYTARGTVSAGTTVDSSAVAVNVNIGNLAPTITLKSSSNSVIANGSITLTATATAKTGTISNIEFFDGTTSLGVITATPYTKAIAFTAANNGTHNYTAKATDSSGNSATSTPATAVTVNIPSTAPVITLTSSSPTVTAAGSVTLTAAVTPGVGTTITKVEFFEGATLLKSDTTSPYTFAPAYTSANNGTHTYTAKVTASDGGTTTSTAATVTVKIPVVTTPGTLIALFTALPAAGSYVNFNHPTSGIKCILYRAPATQTGGVTNAGAFYVAYSRKCTHAGTIITQNPNTANPHVLTCQDHGATYNMDSNCAPINGIAPSALPTIAITVGTDGIYI
jgi:Rieske Fe-S protein